METMLKIKAGIMRVLSIVIIFLFAFMTVIGTYQIVLMCLERETT